MTTELNLPNVRQLAAVKEFLDAALEERRLAIFNSSDTILTQDQLDDACEKDELYQAINSGIKGAITVAQSRSEYKDTPKIIKDLFDKDIDKTIPATKKIDTSVYKTLLDKMVKDLVDTVGMHKTASYCQDKLGMTDEELELLKLEKLKEEDVCTIQTEEKQ